MLERREMFAEVLCGAVALVLYVNTLGADFCYDDRYFGWMNDTNPPVIFFFYLYSIWLPPQSFRPKHCVSALT